MSSRTFLEVVHDVYETGSKIADQQGRLVTPEFVERMLSDNGIPGADGRTWIETMASSATERAVREVMDAGIFMPESIESAIATAVLQAVIVGKEWEAERRRG